MVFDQGDDGYWRCVARNPEHPEMLARAAITHIREIGYELRQTD